MTIDIPVEVRFDSIADILVDLDKLQTYKLYEGSDEILVTKADVADVLARHLVAQEKRKTIEPMRKRGKWTEKHHAYSDEESVIEEWQSCCCSECGRYDTRPYMYYFSTPNYCSYCGADMRGDNNEN